MQAKVTRTFLRTKETMDQYIKVSSERINNGKSVNPFSKWKEDFIKEFTNWVIIKNDFPYDAIAKVNHMICTKREVSFDWNLLNEEELNELNQLKQSYIKDNYDVIWENLPKGQTFPGHFHLHLLILKREEI